jgi:hypothetical protein
MMSVFTHPVFASLDLPSLPQAVKRALKKLHNPLSAEGEERVDKRSDVGVSNHRQPKISKVKTRTPLIFSLLSI